MPLGGVGTVVAGAGSGKTTLLADWTHTRPDLTCVWIAVDDRCTDPTVLARLLVAAIVPVVDGFAEQFSDLDASGGGAAGRVFTARFVVALEELDTDLVIIVDDAHLLTTGSALALLDDIIRRIPDNVRMLVSARYDPPLTLHRLRLEGRLVEIRGGDLAFDLTETRALVESVSGVELDESVAAKLQRRTDGWAVGTQLAALSIRHAPDVTRFVEDFDGSDVLVAQYLTREVLDTLDDRTRRFLMATSVLPWLSVELCGAVVDDMGPSEIEEMLVRLEQELIFVVPGSAHGRRARYHRLFADLIGNIMRLDEPALEGALRRRAAEYLAARGDVAAAVDQYLELRDSECVQHLVVARGRPIYERNESATLVRWLRAAESMSQHPSPGLGVQLLAAEIAALDSVSAAATYWRIRSRGAMSAGEEATAHALYGLLGLDDLPPDEIDRAACAAGRCLEIAGDDLAALIGVEGRSALDMFVHFMPGVAAFHRGDLTTAIDRLEAVLALDAMQYPVWKFYALGMLGLTRAWIGDVDVAESLASKALDLAEQSSLDHHIGVAYARHALVLVALDRLDLTTAAEHLRIADVAVEQSNRAALRATHRWLDAVRVTLADGPTRALAVLDATPPPALGPPVIVNAERDLRIRLRIATGNLLAAGDLLVGVAPVSESARFDLALACGDLIGARAILDSWSPVDNDRRARLGLLVRHGALLAAEGKRRGALSVLHDAVLRAEPGALRSPFLAVPAAVSLLKSDATLAGQPFARSIVAGAHVAQGRGASHEQLIDPLTDREREVLTLLPTRLTNAEMAALLYVSVNTLKTHVRHIYVKLDADGRDHAVERAAQLGIL